MTESINELINQQDNQLHKIVYSLYSILQRRCPNSIFLLFLQD